LNGAKKANREPGDSSTVLLRTLTSEQTTFCRGVKWGKSRAYMATALSGIVRCDGEDFSGESRSKEGGRMDTVHRMGGEVRAVDKKGQHRWMTYYKKHREKGAERVTINPILGNHTQMGSRKRKRDGEPF